MSRTTLQCYDFLWTPLGGVPYAISVQRNEMERINAKAEESRKIGKAERKILEAQAELANASAQASEAKRASDAVIHKHQLEAQTAMDQENEKAEAKLKAELQEARRAALEYHNATLDIKIAGLTDYYQAQLSALRKTGGDVEDPVDRAGRTVSQNASFFVPTRLANLSSGPSVDRLGWLTQREAAAVSEWAIAGQSLDRYMRTGSQGSIPTEITPRVSLIPIGRSAGTGNALGTALEGFLLAQADGRVTAKDIFADSPLILCCSTNRRVLYVVETHAGHFNARSLPLPNNLARITDASITVGQTEGVENSKISVAFENGTVTNFSRSGGMDWRMTDSFQVPGAPGTIRDIIVMNAAIVAVVADGDAASIVHWKRTVPESSDWSLLGRFFNSPLIIPNKIHNCLLVSNGSTASLYKDVSKGIVQAYSLDAAANVTQMSLSDEAEFAAIGTAKGRVYLIDNVAASATVSTGGSHVPQLDQASNAVLVFPNRPQPIQSMAWSYDSSLLAVGDVAGLIAIWQDVRTRLQFRLIEGPAIFSQEKSGVSAIRMTRNALVVAAFDNGGVWSVPLHPTMQGKVKVFNQWDGTLALFSNRDRSRLKQRGWLKPGSEGRPVGEALDCASGAFVSARWNYAFTPREFLRGVSVTISTVGGNKEVTAYPVDWGPGADRGRTFGISKRVSEILGVKEGDPVIVRLKSYPPIHSAP